MTTAQQTELKLPQDPEAAAALMAHFTAVSTLARRRELIAKAQASIAEAQAEVDQTRERCVELGLLPPANGKHRGPRAPRSEGPTQRERVLEALPGTMAELRERTGILSSSLGVALNRLQREGQIVGDGPRGSKVWRVAA